MTTGLSGTYAFNGTNLTLLPTEGRWVERQQFGMDGGGHPIYSSIRSFELMWNLTSPSDYQQVLNFYNAVQNTGTCSVDLPEYGAADYRFKTYSGTTLSEPEPGTYFEGHIQEVRMLIHQIRT